MKILSGRRWSIWIALVLAMMATTYASGPIAVYALVDRVVFEPNDNSPTQIQIWGTFSVAKSRSSGNYSVPEKGYLYYKIGPSSTQSTRTVWADLKKVSGTGEVIGFGGGFAATEDSGRVRPAAEKPKDPELFPIGNPVTRLGTSQADIVTKLKAASQAR